MQVAEVSIGRLGEFSCEELRRTERYESLHYWGTL